MKIRMDFFTFTNNKSNMIRIKRIYEFLELEKSYEYTPIKEPYRDAFKFTADNGETYLITLYGHNVTWCNMKDTGKMWNIDEMTDKNININILFKIINTVFKIIFDTMKERKIKTMNIGSRNKNKFKVYKQSIQEEKDFKIVDEWTEGEKYKVYYIKFEYVNV